MAALAHSAPRPAGLLRHPERFLSEVCSFLGTTKPLVSQVLVNQRVDDQVVLMEAPRQREGLVQERHGPVRVADRIAGTPQ